MNTDLTFNGVTLETIAVNPDGSARAYQNGTPFGPNLWVTGQQLGVALGYVSGPDVAVRKIHARHADEFTPAMTMVVKLQTEGGEQCVRVFSLRGCHLLAMFARTAVAKAFRKWVLDVLDKLNAESQPAIDQQATPSTVADRRALVTLVNTWAQASGLPHSTLWPQVSGYFNLERISDLPKEWIGDAMAFVQERLDALAAAKSQPELSAPAETPALPNPDEEGPLVPALKQLKNLARQFLDVELDVYHNARGRVVVTTETPRVAVEANQCAEKLYSASLAMLEAYMSCARVLAYAFQQAGKAR